MKGGVAKVGDARWDAVCAANDAGRVASLLDDCLARAGQPERVASLCVQRIFYVPGTDLSAVYSVSLRHDGTNVDAVLYGSIRYEDDAGLLLAKAARKVERGRFVAPRLGAPAYHLPQLDMVLWTFPNDPKLKQLPRALLPDVARAALSQLGGPPGEHRGGWEVGAFDSTVVRYIPRKRCVLRYEVEWRTERGADGAPRAHPSSALQHVYAKVYDDLQPAELAARVMEVACRSSLTDGRWFRIPRPLHLDREHNVLYQSALAGPSLVLAAETVTAGDAAEIARGLAQLQQARLPLGATLSLEMEMAKLSDSTRLVAMVHPEFAARLAALERRLRERLPRLPRLPLVPCHGTFKLAHLLHDGDRLGLVDFDSMALADPIYDVANFVADLHYLETTGALPAGRADRLARSFYEAWSAQVPWGRRDAVLDWYVASLLVRKQAFKPVKHLHADATAKIERVLRTAQKRLELDA